MADVAEKLAVDLNEARDFLDRCAEAADEWAGIPMPIEGEALVIHPKYKFAGVLDEEEPVEETSDGTEDRYFPCNQWLSRKTGRVVYVLKNQHGRSSAFVARKVSGLELALRTLGPATAAWALTAETAAMKKLAGMVRQHTFQHYIMTGSFIETSRRSGITYMFRRLRPTIAFKEDPVEGYRVLAALCMHSIGYYKDTYAGCLVPTDDVVSHLLMMRGDEHGFWKMSSQHQAGTANAGI